MNLQDLPDDVLSQFTNNQYQILPAIKEGVCQRCFGTDMGELNDKLYCRQCVNFGRLDTQSKIVLFQRFKVDCIARSYLRWAGQLSSLQQKVSQELKDNFWQGNEHLLWAVTGAGKTEILFATVDRALQQGLRIAVVSPRVDVCEELYPRFQAAFDLDITLMHGKKTDEMNWTQLVIATVHQLLKFRQAFDLIIVDEVDSYPLFGNAWLQEIMLRAIREPRHIIYLSATPPKQILQRVDRVYYLPQRFHGQPLPVPSPKMIIKERILPKKILQHIKQLIQRKQRFLMFFPSIESLERFGKALQLEQLGVPYELVSSRNQQRLAIVERFRAGELFALFTTTILERGVTFNDVDVIVYQAEHRNFSKEVLIQIAGRAGRQLEHYDNQVTFYYFEYHLQIKTAIAEIKKLNKIAENLS